jgi:hypothetical protein
MIAIFMATWRSVIRLFDPHQTERDLEAVTDE